MTLNRRLLLGIAPVLLIFLAVGIYAIFLFIEIGRRDRRHPARKLPKRRRLAEHEGGQPNEMDSGLLLMLGGEEERGKQLFQQYVPVFEKNSDLEAHNITLARRGRPRRQGQATARRIIMDAAAKFFALPPSDPARRALYFDQLLPTFTEESRRRPITSWKSISKTWSRRIMRPGGRAAMPRAI